MHSLGNQASQLHCHIISIFPPLFGVVTNKSTHNQTLIFKIHLYNMSKNQNHPSQYNRALLPALPKVLYSSV